MKNLLKHFDEDERISLLLYSSLYAKREAKLMKKQYEEDKEIGNLNQDVMIIQYLEKLGFPLEEYGTYLYKEVIANVIEILEISNNEMERQQLLGQLNNMYSQFYFKLAKHDNGMGVSVFHAYIQRALDRINPKQKDTELEMSLFGTNRSTIGYGEKAFIIGNAIKNNAYLNDSSYENCKIKQRSL